MKFGASLSGGVMIWRFSAGDKLNEEEEEKIERRAERLVAITFFTLAAYVLYESVKKFLSREAPEVSFLGFAIIILSLIVMPVLYIMKRKTGEKLQSKSLIADSKETLACGYLSVAVLIGLVFNAWFGWWWADSAVGFLIVYFLIKEGIEAWNE